MADEDVLDGLFTHPSQRLPEESHPEATSGRVETPHKQQCGSSCAAWKASSSVLTVLLMPLTEG